MYAHHENGGAGAREFADVYAQYRTRLVRYCRRRLGDGGGDPEDAAHEALLRAFQAWDRFDRTAEVWPWLATIAARVCADLRRRSARVVVDGAVAPAGDVHDQAVSRLRASIVDNALGDLPARYRNALILKEYAGWSYRDIAELEGTTVASVRSSIMRSRRQLGVRVEAVARTRGQWPLPAVVPPVADRLRARARTWRDALMRVLDPAMVVTGFALAMQPVAAGAAPAAMAVAVFATLAGVGPAQPAPAVAEARAPVEAVAGGPVADLPGARAKPLADVVEQAAAAPPAARKVVKHARETLTRIEKEPVKSSLVSARASVAVETSRFAMWLEVHTRYRAPIVGEGRWGVGSSVPCGEPDSRVQRKACRKTAEVVQALPD